MDTDRLLFGSEAIVHAIALIAIARYIATPMFIEMRNMLERNSTEPETKIEQGVDKPK